MTEGINSNAQLVNQSLDSNNLNLFQAYRFKHNVTYFEIENGFEGDMTLRWYQDNFYKTYYIVAFYIAIIFWGKHVMKTREKFDLRGALVLWNFGLAIFSIFGTIRSLPNLLHILMDYQNGFYNSVCYTGYLENKVIGYWGGLFGLSKIVELGDTAFIVLRKQPLIFLHWYHHVSVLVFTWYTGATYSAPMRWYTIMNYAVHSFMYTYYGLKALRFKIPKPIAQAITSLQLVQMVMGITVTVAAYIYKSSGSACETEYKNIAFSLGIYLSYWVLFANFFYQTYVVKGKPKGVMMNGEKKMN